MANCGQSSSGRQRESGQSGPVRPSQTQSDRAQTDRFLAQSGPPGRVAARPARTARHCPALPDTSGQAWPAWADCLPDCQICKSSSVWLPHSYLGYLQSVPPSSLPLLPGAERDRQNGVRPHVTTLPSSGLRGNCKLMLSHKRNLHHAVSLSSWPATAATRHLNLLPAQLQLATQHSSTQYTPQQNITPVSQQ